MPELVDQGHAIAILIGQSELWGHGAGLKHPKRV